MKKLLIFLLFFINIAVYSQNKWEVTQYVPYVENPISIEIPDSLNFYILVQNNKIETMGTIMYHSKDQGKTWSRNFIDQQLEANNLSCPDSLNFFISFDNLDIIKSTNGGKNFIKFKIDSVDYYGFLEMYKKDIGVYSNAHLKGAKSRSLLYTCDGWKTYDNFNYANDTIRLIFTDKVKMKSDSIIKGFATNSFKPYSTYFYSLNINSGRFELTFLDSLNRKGGGIDDFCIVSDSLYFACGRINSIQGGSSQDLIYKSTDAGKTWRKVLDLYSYYSKFGREDKNPPPFGLQSIAFKDSLTGIAVGQFGKYVYTYDGGESWIYDSNYPFEIGAPPVMHVKYAGSIPIVATFSGYFERMVEDILAPKAEDIHSISGRVLFNGKGQPDIPVAIGYRVTMTDSNGYYRFTRLKKGTQTVKVLNKYFDHANYLYYYKPFDYTPERHIINLSRDTSGFDFNAIDLRNYYSISGKVIDANGKGMANLDVRFALSFDFSDGLGLADTIAKTDELGRFEFQNIETYRTWDITPYDTNYKFSPLKSKVRLYTRDTTNILFTGTLITSVNDEEEIKGSIVINPNPATDYITINLSSINPTLKRGVEGEVVVEIYDVMGVLVQYTSEEAIHELPLQRIDISNLSPGVYFVKIVGSNGACSIVEKFVKM